MVQVKYKGQNFLYINGYKIQAGFNDIKDEDFWKMMQTKTFSSRVERKILEVPSGFPLDKPPVISKPVVEKESSASKTDDSKDKEDDQDHRLSVKETLKLIEKSDDAAYLQELVDTETRPRIIDEAKKKLKSLK